MPIGITGPDALWAARFEQERRALEPGLAAWLSSPIQHVGSTAVPGLAAKPIIDMIAGVAELTKARAAVLPLADFGYLQAEHRLDGLYFYRADRQSGGAHTHHLHLTERGSPLWTERLAFRDALCADPGLAEQYGHLKIELAARHPDDLQAYTDGKRAFIAQVLAGVGVTLQPR